jgi:hypothetical protein
MLLSRDCLALTIRRLIASGAKTDVTASSAPIRNLNGRERRESDFRGHYGNSKNRTTAEV